jgi:hypothetical protein
MFITVPCSGNGRLFMQIKDVHLLTSSITAVATQRPRLCR